MSADRTTQLLAADQAENPVIHFLVRTPGIWTHAPVPAIDPPVEVDLEFVLGLLEPTSTNPRTTESNADAEVELTPAHVLTPTWSWVGHVVGNAVEVETASGEMLVLDADDLRLLDEIGRHRTVGELVAVGIEGGVARLARLARGGRLVTAHLPEGSRSGTSTPSSVPTASYEPAAPVAPRTYEPTSAVATTAAALSALTTRAIAEATPVAKRLLSGARTKIRSAQQRNAATSAPTGPSTPAPIPAATPTTTEPAASDAAAPSGTDAPATPETRIPVYAAWPEDVGPPLALGMLTAAARHWNDGALNELFEIRRPEAATGFLDELARRTGPAVLLCSNYVWSLAHNLELAHKAKAINPDLLVVHGGPSSPKFEADAAAFLLENREVADILVRGEGEEVLCELLEVLAESDSIRPEPERLAAIGSITFRTSDDTIVRTADVERIAALDTLPSPYLSGEFEGIGPDEWRYCLSIETNRGCPYGCTFCDWGSATMSRIRKFDLDRVTAEIEWAANVGVHTITITDANFGIMSRDVEIARRIAEIRRRTGHPHSLSWTAAKNTTKHLVKIMDLLVGTGMTVSTSLSLQTTDPSTLEVIDRTNISTDHYVKLAADYRRRGFPLQGDLMVGLPGQTFESYKADLQFMLDHEVMVRSWPVQMLPNSPMNDPEYRARHGIEVGEGNLVTSTATFTEADRRRMFRYRTADTIAERMGLLRHPLRYLQWDHDLAASDLIEHIMDTTDRDPLRFPTLSWVFGYYDLHPTTAVGWPVFYREFRQLVIEDFGIDPEDSAFEAVLQLQEFLMPIPGRTFPAVIELDHDYEAYYRSATRLLYTTGHAALPEQRLTAHGPATFTVVGDPLGLCTDGIHLQGDSRNEIIQGDFHIGGGVANELESSLIRILPLVSGNGITNLPPEVIAAAEAEDRAAEGAAVDPTAGDPTAGEPVSISVSLSPRSS